LCAAVLSAALLTLAGCGSSGASAPAATSASGGAAAGAGSATAGNAAADAGADPASRPPADFTVIIDQPVGKLLNRSDISDTENGKTRATSDGKFILAGGYLKGSETDALQLPQRTQTSDKAFYMSLEVRELKGTPTTFYGLGFHFDDHVGEGARDLAGRYATDTCCVGDKYLFFQTNDTHAIGAGFYFGSSANPFKINRTDGAHTRAGQTNTLVVRSDGTHYTFFVNGYQEADFKDTTPLAYKGGWSALVTSTRPGDAYEFEYGRFLLSSPAVPAAPTPVPVPAAAATATALTVRHCMSIDIQPDRNPACTPGATDPGVTQETIADTICRPDYVVTIPPPAPADEPRVRSEYGLPPGAFVVDYLIPLELGGSTDVTNRWPISPMYAPDKKNVGNALNREVCAGRMTLSEAQSRIVRNWARALAPATN
jgi:hypothetical protein